MSANKISLLSLLLIMTVSPSVVTAQTATPDLSGTWKFNASKSKLPKTAKTESEILVIRQDGVHFEFRYDIDGKQSVKNFEADKKDKVIAEIPQTGSHIVAKAYWKGTTLMTEIRTDFKSTSPLGAYEMDRTQDSWTISPDGLTLTDKSKWKEGQSQIVFDRQ
jgi:hypothetical protein